MNKRRRFKAKRRRVETREGFAWERIVPYAFRDGDFELLEIGLVMTCVMSREEFESRFPHRTGYRDVSEP